MKPLSLEELLKLIPKVVPNVKHLSGLKANEVAKVVTFTWNNAHFVAKPNLEVFERKQERLYITGSSILMTRIFSGNNRKETAIEAVLETMKQAEEFLASGNSGTAKSGFELLKAVKKTLLNMCLSTRKSPTKPAR